MLVSVTAVLPAVAAEAKLLDKTGWSITASSEFEWNKAQNMIDGDKATYWHANYVAESGTIVSRDQAPFTIEITLPAVTNVTGFSYTPRQDSATGRWQEAEVYVSADGKGKGEKAASFTADNTSTADTVVAFNKELKAKKVTVIVTKTVSLGTCAELDLLSGAVSATTTKAETKDDGSINKTDWSITASSEFEWNKAQNMIDGDKETYWHTNYMTDGTSISSHDQPPYTIEITLPEAKAATGLSYTPRQGNATGRWKTAEIYVSSDGKDKGEKAAVLKVDSARTEPTIVAFDKERQVKKLTVIVTDAPSTYGSCAELELLTGKVEATVNPFDGFLDTTGWQVKASSEFHEMPIKYAFDDNLNTIWHSYYEHEGSTITKLDTYPYTIDITLTQKSKISGFTLFGRAAQSGRVLAYELYAAATDDGEYSKVSSGKVNGTVRDEINYGIAFEAKKLRFIVTESIGGYGAISELKFKEATDEKLYSLEEFAAVYDDTMLREVSKNGFNVTCNVETTWGNAKLSNLFDGTSGEWQTGEVTDGEPVILSIDLGKTYVLNTMSVLPRQTQDFHGYWEEFSVWAGTDPDNLSEVIADYSFPDWSLGEKEIVFDTPVTARYVEIEITKYYAKRASCGELTFWHTKADSEKTSGKGKYIMQIGSSEIKVTKSGAESVKTIDTAPFITSAGRTLIPLRGLLEEMGAEIEWVDETQTIIVGCDGKKLTLQINYPLVWAEGRGTKAMYTLESAPRIKDSRTFVPLRFLSEQFGYEVTWDGATQTITIEK